MYDTPAAKAAAGWWSASPEAEAICAQYGVGNASPHYETVDHMGVGAPTSVASRASGTVGETPISTTGFELCHGVELPQQVLQQFREHQSRAMAILGDDPARHQAAWRALVGIGRDTDACELEALAATCVRAQHMMLAKTELRQPEAPSECAATASDDPAVPSYWSWILKKFATEKPALQAGLAEIRAVCGSRGTVRRGPVKSRERAEQKAKLCYDGDMALISDYGRAECVCADIQTAHSVVDFLLSERSPFPTVRVKNRFAVEHPAARESGGSRAAACSSRPRSTSKNSTTSRPS